MCSLVGPGATRPFLSLLLSPQLLVAAGPSLARFLSLLVPGLELADLLRLLAALQPARPDLAPLYYKLTSSPEEDSCTAVGVAAVKGIMTDKRSATAVSLLQLFLSLLLEVIHRQGGSKVTSYDLTLLPRDASRSKKPDGPPPLVCDRAAQVVGVQSVKEVRLSAGYAHVLVNRSRGPPLAWGASGSGCTGLLPSNAAFHPPGPLAALTGIRVVQVACGRSHSLALTDCGVYSWGSNRFGQLGLGDSQRPVLARTSTPTWIAFRDSNSPDGAGCSGIVTAGLSDVIVKISAGQYHSLAVDAGGRLYSWGWGVHGQLGHQHTNVEDVYRPTVVGLLRRHRIVDAAGGFAHSIALTAKGTVYSFGLGLFGQIGGGTTTKATRPSRVQLPAPARLIASGYFHSLAVLDGQQQQLYQWGAHPQVLRLEAQQRRKERLLLQKALESQKNTMSAKEPHSLSNGSLAGYCNGGTGTHSVITEPLVTGNGGPEVPLDLSVTAPVGSLQPESLPAFVEPVSELHLSPQVSSPWIK